MQANSNHQVRKTIIGSIASVLVVTAALTPSLRVSAHSASLSVNSLRQGHQGLAASNMAAVAQSNSANSTNNGSNPNDGLPVTETKWVGTVISAPINGLIGQWQIVVNLTTTSTIIVDSATELRHFGEHKRPVLGAWVEAKGTIQPDGSLLARRLRPDDFEEGEVVVRLKSGSSENAVKQFADTHHLKLIDTLLSSAGIYRFTTDGDERDESSLLMSNDPNVIWAEVNFTSGIPKDPEGNPYRSWRWGGTDPTGYVNQTAFSQVNLTPAQGLYKGDGIIVAVLDTGLDVTHPAFRDNLVPASDMRDMISDDAIPQDGPEPGQAQGVAQGHGTHVSGIISHIAPNAKIMPIRVLDTNGRGNTFVLAYAIDWAVQHGADVINLSLGTDFQSTVLSNSISSAVKQGVIVVAAAGNDNFSIPQYPAAFAGVLGVTAVDEHELKATFANFGVGWVDLAAPGVGITSTVPAASGVLYASWSGTSMATPFASGAAALERQRNPTDTVAQIGEILVASGGNIDAVNPGYGNQLGRQLDIGAALVGTPPVVPPLDSASTHLYLPAIIQD